MNAIQTMNRKATIASLWLVYLLNIIFRDIHEFAKHETLEQLLAGVYNGIEPTEVLFLIGGIIVSIPISMVFFSQALPWKANRWANVIVAVLMIATVVTGTHTDLDDYYHAALEIAALLGVIWLAWRWQPQLGNAVAIPC